MDELEFSSWLGKPPRKKQKQKHDRPEKCVDSDVGMSDQGGKASKHTDSAVEIPHQQSQTRKTRHQEVEDDNDGEEEIQSVSATSEPTTPQAPSMSRSNFYIEVPEIANSEDYEHLPGYLEAKRIISEVKEDRFVVKLRSGEKATFTLRQLHQLDNGAEALKEHRNKSMVQTGGRHVRKPLAPGMVDWTQVHVISSDEEPSGENGRHTRRTVYALEDSAEDVPSPGKSTGEDIEDDLDPREVASRRSMRLRVKKSVKPANRDYMDLDDSDDVLRTRGRAIRIKKPLDSQRGSRRARRSRYDQTNSSNDDDVSARRSERTRARPRHNMRERQEDEISLHSEEETGPKVVATKEHFPRVPENDPFRRRHRPDCDACSYKGDKDVKGPLVFCQGCTNSHHKGCLGPRGSRDHLVTKVGEGMFVLQCRRCLGLARSKDRTAPHHGYCEGCKEPSAMSKPLRNRLTTRQEQLQREENGGKDPITIVESGMINNVANVMFRCALCSRAWHLHHMPERKTVDSTDDSEDDVSEEQLAQKRFDYYHRSWTCKDCVENQNQIDALVAWRPTDLESYIPGMTGDDLEESRKEYLIKWRSQSYFRTTWMPGTWVHGIALPAMRTAFMKRPENYMPKMTTKDAIPEDFFRIDVVLDVRYSSIVKHSTKEIDLARVKEVDTAYVKYKGLGYEDAIWEKPPTYKDTERFADFQSAYQQYVLKRHVSISSQSTLRRHLLAIRQQDFGTTLEKKVQPSTLTGGEMMKYQLDGLNWLYYQWFRNQNAILADEMGLGKTIQLIALFATLVQDNKCWPFLVVVPNSTCPNWRREIRKWAPSLRVVTYYGSSMARKLTHDFELFPKDKDKEETSHKLKRGEVKDIKAHVVVASYESISDEKTRQTLQRVPWQALIVDEGQRLKNDKNLLYDALTKLRIPFRILMTGTPLQNNARELFNLLQFLDRKIDAAAMEAKYETLTADNVPELHDLIRPFFLRRTKVQVLTFLPPMAQIILPVTMSSVQKKLYKSILAKNPQLMKSIFSHGGALAQKERHNLNNILMQLRKTLCHPFVYSREIEERSYEQAVSHRNLVEASSKLQLLQIMLPKLQERGHRVLLFSQFLDNLDIVEDFLDGLGLQHRRLDGGINSMEKQKRIDEFNAPDSPYFAFLLSTRSGGVGINLATADTVIIMDPDFNPHQDIQALSRAHRIGQNRKVLVFRIMNRGSAEEKMMQIGKKKMSLDHVIIQQLDQEDDAGMDLESILRHGATALFEDDSTGDIHYDSASVDRLLDRSQIEDTNTGDDKSAESQFTFARIWDNDKAALEDGVPDSESATPTLNPGVWDKILQEREKAYQEEAARNAVTFGRGKRKRQNVNYDQQPEVEGETLTSPFQTRGKDEGSDTDFQAQVEEEAENETPGEESDVDVDDELGVRPVKQAKPPRQPTQPTIKARPFRRVKVPKGTAPLFNGDGPSDYVPMGGMPSAHLCSACDETHAMGWCRLKIAGVEHCGLCGLAHVGHGRTCPHLNNEMQVTTLLRTLKESTEERELIEQAQKYLRIIRGDLVQRKRVHEQKQAEEQARLQRDMQVNGPGPSAGPPRSVGSVNAGVNGARSIRSSMAWMA